MLGLGGISQCLSSAVPLVVTRIRLIHVVGLTPFGPTPGQPERGLLPRAESASGYGTNPLAVAFWRGAGLANETFGSNIFKPCDSEPRVLRAERPSTDHHLLPSPPCD